MQDKYKILQIALSEVITNLRKDDDTKYLKFCDENSISTSTYDNIKNASTNATLYTVSKFIRGFGLNFEKFGALLDKKLPKEFWEED